MNIYNNEKHIVIPVNVWIDNKTFLIHKSESFTSLL